MKMIALTCTQCKAPLDVPAGSNNVECDYCGTAIHLTAHKSSSQQNDGQLKETEEILKLRGEIEKLDREWEDFRSQFLNKGENGEYNIPIEKDIVHMMIGVKFVGFLLVAPMFVYFLFNMVRNSFRSPLNFANHSSHFSNQSSSSPIFFIFIIAAMIILTGIFSFWKLSRSKLTAIVYQASLSNYKKLRLQLVQKIEKLKSAG